MNERETRLIIPDIHHKIGLVDRIRSEYPGIPAIFLGDYFDDFYDTPADMEVTCRWLKQAIERGQETFLLGNHCFANLSYELGVRWGYCSGWDGLGWLNRYLRFAIPRSIFSLCHRRT